MKKILMVGVAAMLFFSGCGLLTLQPIFTTDELLFDARLVGTWKSKEGVTRFDPATAVPLNEIPEKLRPFRNKFYLCTRQSDDDISGSRSLAFLVRIGNHLFLDQFPLETLDEQKIDRFFAEHHLKMHEISRIDLGKNNTMIWRAFKDNYVEDMIKSRQVRIDHRFITDMNGEQNELVITASTKELQGFLVKYGSKKEAYQDDENIHFKKLNVAK